MLPEGWHRSTLGEIARISSGGTPDRAEPKYWGGDVPWVTTGEIQFNTITDTNEKITEAGLKYSSAKLFPPGTLLMAMYGQGKTRGQVAKLGIEAATNQACAAILLPEMHDTDFFFQYLSSQYEAIRELGNAGTQQNLSGGILKEVPVPVPPLSEQRRIARVLSTWDQAIAATERLLANSRRQKQMLLTMLTGGIRRLGASLAAWRTFKLGDLGAVYGGLSGKSGEDFGIGSKFIPYVNVFNNYRIDLAALGLVKVASDEKQSRVQFGDVLFTTSSETPNEVGMAAVLLDEVEELFLNSFCFGYRLHDFGTLLPEYAGYVLRSPAIRSQMTQLAQGSTRFNISKTQVMRLTIQLPSIEEQRLIIETLHCASSAVEHLSGYLRHLRTEKTALMAQLLTGKRRVSLPGRQAATAL